jgi:hypothetical protein
MVIRSDFTRSAFILEMILLKRSLFFWEKDLKFRIMADFQMANLLLFSKWFR